MPEVTSKEERSRDVSGVITYTVTRQGTDTWITPEANARSWRAQHSDAIYTLVEEYIDLSQSEPQFQIDGSVSTEPLETNALFNGASSAAKDNWLKWKNGKPTNPVSWDPANETDVPFATFYWWYKNGQESYFAPRTVIRMTEVEAGPPDQTNIGKIDERIAAASGASFPSGVNFLLTGARGQQEGDVWRNTYEVTSSSSNGWGWNTDIYAQTAINPPPEPQ